MKGMISRRALLGGAASISLCGRVASASTNQTEIAALWFDWEPWIKAGGEIFANCNVAVELRPAVFGDLDRRIRMTSGQSQSFDLIMMDGPNIPTYVAAGLLEPLTRIFANDLSDFLPSPKRAATIGGEFYGPAMDDSSQALWYNMEILDRYNIKPPSTLSTAWTWSQAREVFIEVQAKERQRIGSDRFWALSIGQAGQLGGGTYTGLNLSRSAGELDSPTYRAISPDGVTVSGFLDTNEAIGSYKFLQDLYNRDGLVPKTDGTEVFSNGQCAFWLAGLSRRRVFAQANSLLKAGVTPHPYFKTPIVQTGSFHVGVSAFSDRKKEAQEALVYLSSPPNLEIMAMAAGDFPTRRSLIPKFDELVRPPLDIFADTVVQWAQPCPQTAGYAEFADATQRMLRDIASGANVSDTVATTVAELTHRLRRYANFHQSLGR